MKSLLKSAFWIRISLTCDRKNTAPATAATEPEKRRTSARLVLVWAESRSLTSSSHLVRASSLRTKLLTKSWSSWTSRSLLIRSLATWISRMARWVSSGQDSFSCPPAALAVSCRCSKRSSAAVESVQNKKSLYFGYFDNGNAKRVKNTSSSVCHFLREFHF